VIIEESEKYQQILAHLIDLVEQRRSPSPAVPSDDGTTNHTHDLSRAIHQAAQQDDPYKLRVLLTPGVSVDILDGRGRTPLHLAASGGHIDVVKLLCRRHADVNWQDDSGQTPLHLAMIAGHIEIARILLANNADKDIKDDNGTTPPNCADQNLSTKWMLKYGAGLESRDPNNGNTALLYATVKGDTTTIKSLLAMGANKDAKNNYSSTPLAEACMRGHLDAIEVLLAHGADPNAKGDSDWTPLSRCIWANQEAALRILLKYGGADLEGNNTPFSHTALSEAVRLRQWPNVRWLVEHGANVEAKDREGYPILCRAAQYGRDIGTVRLLLQYGADIAATNGQGWTALHEAVWHGHYHIMRLLIEHGANVTCKDVDGYPFLCRASQRGRDIETIRLLLDSGADIEATNRDGWTATREAVFHGWRDILLLLLAKEPDLDSRVDIGFTDGHRTWTYLMHAARQGHLSVVVELVEHGAQLEAADSEGWTALRVATEYKQDAVASALLFRGADRNSKGNDGVSPVSRASTRHLPEFVAICRTMYDDYEGM
jgi:ankyrin repeat domain-containing protein 50